MASSHRSPAEQSWRLVAKLDVSETRRVLDRVVGRLRGPAIVGKIEAEVPDDVVITHDGGLLFAYATDEAALKAARGTIESVLAHDGITASVQISHWDDQLDEWHQTEPPVSAEAKQVDDTLARDAETRETRTLVAIAGKRVRAEFEQTMLTWADRLGLKCEISEHPHLLTTQVGFTVTGPKRKVDEFAQGLIAEGQSFIRAERSAMTIPL